MRTVFIERPQWASFAEDLTTHHRGWIVDMEIYDPASGIRKESRRCPLHEIAIETRIGDHGTLFLSVGDQSATLSHWVNRLSSVWLEQSDDGLPEAVELESESGERTLLSFPRIPVSRQLP